MIIGDYIFFTKISSKKYILHSPPGGIHATIQTRLRKNHPDQTWHLSTGTSLTKTFEQNLEDLLGVSFIASEVTTGDRQRGRIDTLGIDQDGNPTIVEYKKSAKDNVINQGLFYLDWLVDHKGDFTLLAQKNLKICFD
jgi:RecB family endonuclease NucS